MLGKIASGKSRSRMIVVFHDLGEYPAGEYQGLIDNPEDFLAKSVTVKEDQGEFLPWRKFRLHNQLQSGGWTEHEGGTDSLKMLWCSAHSTEWVTPARIVR